MSDKCYQEIFKFVKETAESLIRSGDTSATYITFLENEKIHYTNITVTGKICNDKVAGSIVSKIQSTDGTIYGIPNSECPEYPYGLQKTISYQHICGMSVREPGPLDYMCFNRTVGVYP